MPKDPKDLNILFETKNWYLLETRDQSPSLSFKGDTENIGESMHSHDGAFSETLYIYEPVLKNQSVNPKLLSLGLGLGYNETMATAWSIKNKVEAITIDSFESEAFLIENFKSFIENSEPFSEEQAALFKSYQYIFQKFSEYYQTPLEHLRTTMLERIKDESIRFFGALDLDSLPSTKYNGIFFDAFSSNTSPNLWSEEFLRSFFTQCTHEVCIVSTYAATGALKRSLKEQNFEVLLRKGFSHKRQSTLAFKGNIDKNLKVEMGL